MIKTIVLIYFLVIALPSISFAKGKSRGPEIEPYMVFSHFDFKREGIYSGKTYAAGVGARVGFTLGPLFLAGDAAGQTAPFLEDRISSVADRDPAPSYRPWYSFGGSVGIKTRIFSLMYTYIFASELETRVYYDNPSGVDSYYSYKFKGGTGSKISAMIHFSSSFSLGVEKSSYSFDKYYLEHDTHLLTAGDNLALSPKLEISGWAILINYKIEVQL